MDTFTREQTTRQRLRNKILNMRQEWTEQKLPIGIIIGICMTLVTIILQCVAFFTPHWKEISANAHTLYVDGIDALIRTEVLYYFDNVHRYTHHSYGLFQRCEYVSSNISKFNNQYNIAMNNRENKCTKNYLPTYHDDHFNECHSLAYYQFCTKSNDKIFDISNDYLRTTLDISSSHANEDSKILCACRYPSYVVVCRIIVPIALIFLFITTISFGLFPFFTIQHRLKIKYFGILSSVLSTIFLMINLIITMQHLEYESIAFLIAIEKHYQLHQIYKLSQDTRIAIDRFLSSIKIRIGYSTVVAWIAFILSIVDGILLLVICKIKDNHNKEETRDNLIPPKSDRNDILHSSISISNDAQSSSHILRTTMSLSESMPFIPNRQDEKWQPYCIQNEDEV